MIWLFSIFQVILTSWDDTPPSLTSSKGSKVSAPAGPKRPIEPASSIYVFDVKLFVCICVYINININKYIYIYGKCPGFARNRNHNRQCIIIITVITTIIIFIIKPLLKIFNECRSLTGWEN